MSLIYVIKGNNVIRFLYNLFKDFYIYLRAIFNLYLPNINKFIRKQILLGKKNVANQKIYMTGKGKIEIGNNNSFGFKLGGYYRRGYIEIQARDKNSKVTLGDSISTNNNILIAAKDNISIGNYCLIGQGCEFLDSDGHSIKPDERFTSSGLCEPVIIGNNVWFGNNCMILRGTVVGDNCVIAAGSVIKGRFGNNLIIGGVPAKIIRKIE